MREERVSERRTRLSAQHEWEDSDTSPFYWYQRRKGRWMMIERVKLVRFEWFRNDTSLRVFIQNWCCWEKCCSFSFSTTHWWCAYVYSISECIIEKTISAIGGKIVSIVPKNWRKREGCSIGKFGKVSQNRSLLESWCVFICLNVPSTSQSIRSQKAQRPGKCACSSLDRLIKLSGDWSLLQKCKFLYSLRNEANVDSGTRSN